MKKLTASISLKKFVNYEYLSGSDVTNNHECVINFRYKEKIDDSAPGDAQNFVAQPGGSRAVAGQPENGPGDNTPQMRRKKPRQD